MATAQPQGFEPQLKVRKKSRFWRGLGLASLLTVAGATAYATLTTGGREITQDVTNAAQVGWEVKQNPNLVFDSVGGAQNDYVNILLIGEDRSWKETEVFNPRTGKMARFHVVDKTKSRSDTMIVVSLHRDPNDPTGNAVRLISFPRDARVKYVMPDGERYKGKMNGIYALGGANPKDRESALRNFFRDEMGLRIDRVMRIRIEGLTGLIDKVGGLDIDVDGATKHKHGTSGPLLRRQHIFYEDNYGQWKVDLEPGMQHLDGTQAVGYARYRYDVEGDPGRIRRQQQVMRALAKKITSQPLLQLPGVVKQARSQLDTDLSDQELASMALFAQNLGIDSKIQPLTVFGVAARTGNRGDIILNKPENVKLFSTIFGPTFNAQNFLNRSPETRGDEYGLTNNRSASAQEVLRQAGILKDDAKPVVAPGKDAT